jgi:hypothetical protein
MRLSIWLIFGLLTAYMADMVYYDGVYGAAVITLFRKVGLGVLAGLSHYV